MGERSITISCKRCGKFYQDDGYFPKLCRKCREKDNEDFEKVREYLYDNGTATALEIEEATGIPVKQTERYLREGRLEVPADSPIFIKCENCGKDIRTGRFCNECLTKLSKSLNDIKGNLIEMLEEEPAQMRYFNQEDKKYNKK